MKKNNHVKDIIVRVLVYLVATLVALCASMIRALCSWASRTFNVNLNAIINTMLNSLQGTSEDTIRPAVLACVPWVVCVIIVIGVLIWFEHAKIKEKKKRNLFYVWILLGSFLYLLYSIWFVQQKYDFIDYFKNRNAETSLYADRYVDPRLVNVSAKDKKRNLVYIYLESMENTYADTANGGAQETNYIPYLTQLAKEEISFSPTEGIGGFQATDGATWTMGALFATTAGVPFEFPVGNNDMGKQEVFASGIYTLGDFLNDEGYNQMFLCGSDGAFAGRKKYFEQHGNYQVYDYFMARDNGDIPPDYKVWWGFEDAKLFDIAKEQLIGLASDKKPFNFTMLTVDMHHIGGYICQLCKNEYEDQTANVVSCTDLQLSEFMEWLEQQDFYENTTVVITGDHPRMDNHLVEGVAFGDRLVYDCIVNAAVPTQQLNEKRSFAGVDMFPTTLAAMGYEIPGNRLGLGVNLFSSEPTLTEELGMAALDTELMKSSKYYIEHFAPELSYLIEDEFDSLQTIYFYGKDFNADQFVMSQFAQVGIASWVIGDSLTVDIPLDHEDGTVVVKFHIQDTFNGKQEIRLFQNEAEIGTVKVKGNCVVEIPLQMKDGHVRFSLLLPDAISANELDAANLDTNKLSLLLNSITVNEAE